MASKAAMEFVYGDRVRSFDAKLPEYYGVVGVVVGFDVYEGVPMHSVRFPSGDRAWFEPDQLMRHRGHNCACCKRIEADPPAALKRTGTGG